MMKNFIVMIFSLLTVVAYGQRDVETINKSIEVKDQSKEFWFCICNINGDIEAEAYDGTSIEVEFTKELRVGSEDELEKVKKEIEVKTLEGDDFVKLFIHTPYHNYRDKADPLACGWQWKGNAQWRNVDYEFDFKVKIPRNLSVKLSTINRGDVYLKNVEGEVFLSNVNGSVYAEGVKSNTKATTVNGKVNIDFDQLPTEFGEFDTVNGDITLRLPESAQGVFNFESERGRIYSDFDFTKKLPAKMVKTSGKSGGTKYKIDHTNGYQLGEGGPEFDFKTLNGSVKLVRKD